MQIILDPSFRQKLLAVKGEQRVFTLEFPSNCDTAELYGVVTEMKTALWESIQEAKAKEEETEAAAIIKELEKTKTLSDAVEEAIEELKLPEVDSHEGIPVEIAEEVLPKGLPENCELAIAKPVKKK